MSALTRILAKEKTVDQLSAKATDDIAFQRFKRKMSNNGWSGQCNILILARVATFAAVARGTSEVTKHDPVLSYCLACNLVISINVNIFELLCSNVYPIRSLLRQCQTHVRIPEVNFRQFQINPGFSPKNTIKINLLNTCNSRTR